MIATPGETVTDSDDAAPEFTSAEEKFRYYVMPEVEVLYRVARSITRRQHDAEDLVQDTMLRAYRAIDSFDGRHPRAWLLTILRNTNVNRNRRRRPELLHDPDRDLERLVEAPASDMGPEDLVVDAEFDSVVADAYKALPERSRRVVQLVDIEGFGYAEAADLLGIPVGTVMSRLHRARTKMRRQLDAAGVASRATSDPLPRLRAHGGTEGPDGGAS